jgi:hypothetical protein
MRASTCERVGTLLNEKCPATRQRPGLDRHLGKEMTMAQDTCARFWAKVDKNGPVPPHRPELGPCWVWTACRLRGSYGLTYGRMMWKGGKVETAHRISWELEHGAPPTRWVLHHCDHHPCVRPSHLYEGDRADNVRDCIERDRLGAVGNEWNRGTLSHNAKLSAEDVAAIRARYAAGGIYMWQLGEEYGVMTQQISRIVRRERWAWM